MQPHFDLALKSALAGGARLVQVREKDLSYAELFKLAREAKNAMEQSGAELIVNESFRVAQKIGAGLHLPERELEVLAASRRALGESALISASVHSIQAAQRAEDGGANYLIFGSVFKTASHPESPAAGVDALQQVCRAVEIPVFAVGGITLHNARECLDAGAHGVAVISAIWSTPDVGQAVRELLEVLEPSA